MTSLPIIRGYENAGLAARHLPQRLVRKIQTLLAGRQKTLLLIRFSTQDVLLFPLFFREVPLYPLSALVLVRRSHPVLCFWIHKILFRH